MVTVMALVRSIVLKPATAPGPLATIPFNQFNGSLQLPAGAMLVQEPLWALAVSVAIAENKLTAWTSRGRKGVRFIVILPFKVSPLLLTGVGTHFDRGRKKSVLWVNGIAIHHFIRRQAENLARHFVVGGTSIFEDARGEG